MKGYSHSFASPQIQKSTPILKPHSLLLASLFILSELLRVLPRFPSAHFSARQTDEIVATVNFLFLNHRIKCSFHHSSPSFPLTNSERGVEQRNGLCFAIDYPFPKEGRLKRPYSEHRELSHQTRGNMLIGRRRTHTKEIFRNVSCLANQRLQA